MPKEPLPMRKIRSVLELHNEGVSIRKIARALDLKRSTVSDYLARAVAAQVTWPLSDEWTEDDLHQALFGPSYGTAQRPFPDYSYINKELRRKGVTLQLLHDEYLLTHPDGYQYSQYCELYRRWRKTLNVSMRQTHRAGEKLFVDFAGQTIPVHDLAGGVTHVQLFVAVMGATNYTYAEAVATQTLPDWIDVHCNTLEYLGGVPALTICDNLRSGVTTACWYEPLLNATYEDWSRHYGTCVMAARPGKPKDKAKVENGVLVAERWLLAALRNHTFFSLAELNAAIRPLLERLNNRPFKKLPGSRASLFEELDMPALKPLRTDRYEFAEWRRAKVSIDYHVALHLGDRRYHYYSVHYSLLQQEVQLRISRSAVEIYFKAKRVAAHQRDDTPGASSTLTEHMPEAHKRHAKWTPSRILRWAKETGESCRQVAQQIMDNRPHPEQGFRSCVGLISLGDRYTPTRLEAACRRALALDLVSYTSIRNILASNQDKLPLADDQQLSLPINNPTNVRGSAYYQ